MVFRRLSIVLMAYALAGCGFHRAATDDGGGAMASDLADGDGPDGDLPGVVPVDMAATDGGVIVTAGTGPGPAGALPSGFCCNSNDDCRSRNCVALLEPVHYCSDECDHDSICSAWGGNFDCDLDIGYCKATTVPATCLDPSLYHYGAKPIGSCCQSGFDKSGQECEDGLCNATGPSANPFYCTQGCDLYTPCPAPYVCNSAGFCSLPDANAAYTCK